MFIWTWIKDKYNQFQNWAASWAPGLKTRLAAFLGFIGTAAAYGQEWITGLPLTQFVSGTTVTVATMVLFSLAFWFRGLANRA